MAAKPLRGRLVLYSTSTPLVQSTRNSWPLIVGTSGVGRANRWAIRHMETNPYSSPTPADADRAAFPSIRHRTFGARSVSFKLTQKTYRDDVRREAQQAIDQEIGADNVISIIEHAGSFEGFSVVVWYRVPPPEG